MTIVESMKRSPRQKGQASASLVEGALSILREGLSRWTVARSSKTTAAESASVNRRLALAAEQYRDYLVRNERGLPDDVLKDLLVASAELDGICAAHYGQKQHDRSSRREADKHLREIEKVQERVNTWLNRRQTGEEWPATTKRNSASRTDLRSVIKSRGSLPLGERIQIAHGIRNVVDSLHQAGIAPGDIKFENVLIDTSGDVSLVDIGWAGQRRKAAVTPGYIAPEQVAAGVGTPASDVYSVDIVLYELLLGQLSSPNLFENQSVLIDFVFSSTSAFDPELQKVIARVLKRNPELLLDLNLAPKTMTAIIALLSNQVPATIAHVSAGGRDHPEGTGHTH